MTKKLVKEKINIKDMTVRISKLRKDNKRSVILSCDDRGEMEKLKVSMQSELGMDYNIKEPKVTKPKVKVVNVAEEEMCLEDENLVNVIGKQNNLEEIENVHIRII